MSESPTHPDALIAEKVFGVSTALLDHVRTNLCFAPIEMCANDGGDWRAVVAACKATYPMLAAQIDEFVECGGFADVCANPTGSHPDAPRAGGETPAIDLGATLALLDKMLAEERAAAKHHRTVMTEWPVGSETRSEASRAALRADRAAHLAKTLRAALPSLLARHRDGERDTKRLDWLERAVPSLEFRDFCNGLSTPWPGTFREFVDAAMSAGPSPERASK